MAYKKKPKLTPTEQAWAKEIRRLKQFIRRTEKRGFSYPPSIIPKKPEKITKKSVQQLQKITPQVLYQRAEYKDPKTGETLTGIEGRTIERSRASKKAAQTIAIRHGRVVSDNYAIKTPHKTMEHLWNKEVRRIKSLMREAEKRGFTFDNIIPDKPYHITQADIDNLKSINGKTIYEHATYTDPLTGEDMSGVAGRQLERSRAAKKGAKNRKQKDETTSQRDDFYRDRDDMGTGTPPSQTFEILENIREYIRQWAPSSGWTDYFSQVKEHDKNTLERILEGAVAQEGEEAVAKRLEDNANEVNYLLEEILYGSGGKHGRNQINFDLVRFSAIVMGRALTIEESQELTDIAENLEVDY